jgi:hypothetical protein
MNQAIGHTDDTVFMARVDHNSLFPSPTGTECCFPGPQELLAFNLIDESPFECCHVPFVRGERSGLELGAIALPQHGHQQKSGEEDYTERQ